MGYAVYWANGRWQGYGIPAYCDHKGCYEEIDRGIGYQYEGEEETFAPSLFVCNRHQGSSLENLGIDLNKEHPQWLKHILEDDSWKPWRDENPDVVSRYHKILLEHYNEKAL